MWRECNTLICLHLDPCCPEIFQVQGQHPAENLKGNKSGCIATKVADSEGNHQTKSTSSTSFVVSLQTPDQCNVSYPSSFTYSNTRTTKWHQKAQTSETNRCHYKRCEYLPVYLRCKYRHEFTPAVSSVKSD